MNCRWGNWSAWESCSVTCGGGTQKRSRVQVQRPQNGGRQCEGSYTHVRSCGTQRCELPTSTISPTTSPGGGGGGGNATGWVISKMKRMVQINTSIFCRCFCGLNRLRRKGFSSKVVGGEDAGRGEIGWQVGLAFSPSASPVSTFCGGTLINEKWVLTAAHCTEIRYNNHYSLKMSDNPRYLLSCLADLIQCPFGFG